MDIDLLWDLVESGALPLATEPDLDRDLQDLLDPDEYEALQREQQRRQP